MTDRQTESLCISNPPYWPCLVGTSRALPCLEFKNRTRTRTACMIAAAAADARNKIRNHEPSTPSVYRIFASCFWFLHCSYRHTYSSSSGSGLHHIQLFPPANKHHPSHHHHHHISIHPATGVEESDMQNCIFNLICKQSHE